MPCALFPRLNNKFFCYSATEECNCNEIVSHSQLAIVTVSHPRVTVSHPRVTVSHPRVESQKCSASHLFKNRVSIVCSPS